MKLKPISLMKDKRGMTIGDIYPTMLVIALVAILIAVVLLVLSQFGDTIATDSFAVINETNSFVNETGYTLNVVNSSTCKFNTPALTVIWAVGTGGDLYNVTVPLTNATVSSIGIVTNLTVATNANTSLSYNYKSGDGGLACDSLNTISQQISDFVPWIGIILLIIAAAIVIGILVKNLGSGRRV
ncbi:MAG TPA: hypothetical protein ENH99_02740 [Candidatus Pacearchaeota archaeon]|nr:hypothetical protein [Candidatus Pacearchaeota archaeon]